MLYVDTLLQLDFKVGLQELGKTHIYNGCLNATKALNHHHLSQVIHSHKFKVSYVIMLSHGFWTIG